MTGSLLFFCADLPSRVKERATDIERDLLCSVCWRSYAVRFMFELLKSYHLCVRCHTLQLVPMPNKAEYA